MNPQKHNQEISSEIRKQLGLKKRIVFVSGNFNTIHPGHFRLLKFAEECGDFLVIGVTNNDTAGVLVPEELRLEGVRSINYVDYSFILNSPPEQLIQILT